MTREMDAQFSLDTVADLPDVMARRAEAAEAALDRWPVYRAIPYGSGAGETLNVFSASTSGKAPVLFFIHGGFWRSLDADLFSFLADGFVEFGATVVIIDYPLMPATRLAELLESCTRALRWTGDNITRYGGDPSRIHICGNSAGGHLVAELACSSRGLERFIAGAIPISGIYDLEPVTRSFQNDSLSLSEEEVTRFSPLRRDYRPVVPMLAAVGGDETGEFLRQTRDFAAACSAAGVASQAVEVPFTNHVTILTEALARHGHPFNRQVRRLMGIL